MSQLSDEPPSVAAVVVTYNRADKLAVVLERVMAQTTPPRWVFVIDNASTDHTPAVLGRWSDDDRVRVHRLAENTGGAGGFAEGMSLAYAACADLVWIMDDDCYAEPDALDRLVAGHSRAESLLGEPVPFAGSLVRWTDGSLCIMNSPPASVDWADLIVRGENITLVDQCSFVSLLIPAWAIERYGLPLRPYFIWYDDAEYTRRLRAGGRGIQVHDSLVVHDLGENSGVNVTRLDATNLWKFRYGMRNESSCLWHRGRRFQWLEFVLMTTVRMHRGHVRWRHRAVVFGRIVAGLSFNPAVERVRPRASPSVVESAQPSTPAAVPPGR